MAQKGGQPGNKNATKERRIITDALRRVVTQNPERLAKACEKVLEDAENGSLYALSFIADRLDGKPSQTVDMTLSKAINKAEDLTDDELADIATNSSAGVVSEAESSKELH